MVGAPNKYINHKNTKRIWWLVSFLTNLFPSWQEMLPCGSSCGVINVISYQPFSIMPCMHLESCGDLNFKLRHISSESWPSPEHRRSQWICLGGYLRVSLLSPKNNFSHCLIKVSKMPTFIWFFGLNYYRLFLHVFQKYVELWHIKHCSRFWRCSCEQNRQRTYLHETLIPLRDKSVHGR